MFHSLNFWYTNADSLPNKISELELRIQAAAEKPHIIAITEVKPKNSRYKVQQSELQLQGYDMFSTNLETQSNRGIIVYTLNTLEAVVQEIEEDDPQAVVYGGTQQPLTTNRAAKFEESVWMNIKLKGKDTLLVGCVYRSPNSTDGNASALNTLLRKICSQRYSHTVIVGDFNYPDINWENWTTASQNENNPAVKFIETLHDCYLTQNVSEPTRGRGTTNPSLIDLVLTTEEDMVTDIKHTSPLGKSDHAVLTFSLQCVKEEEKKKFTKWLYDKGDYEGMKQYLDIEWNTIFLNCGDDMDKQYAAFLDKYKEAREKFIPQKTYTKDNMHSSKHKVALDRSILNRIKKKHRCWKRYIETRDQEKYKEYVRERNFIRKSTRRIQREKEMDIAKQAKTNPKKFWQYVNSKTKTKRAVSELLVPGVYDEKGDERLTQNDLEKAEVLSEHFSSVFTEEPTDDIPRIEDKVVDKHLDNITINRAMIQKLLKKLKVNKSPGPDSVHPRVLKELHGVMSEPLAIMMNNSFKLGQVPLEWKNGIISAIYKKGNRKLAGNYRPVSLTSIICKIMESVIRDAITDHLKRNKLFSRNQYGFISGRSTILQLLHVLENWTKILEEGDSIDVIYMDFMKAFDKVPHQRLLGKLKSYGLAGNTLQWITSFLSSRTQKVVINGTSSSPRQVTSGIPQGSVLGPLLFVVYINDLPDATDSPTYLFADDTKIYRRVTNDQESKELQDDINNLQEWSDRWLLKFHPDKCVHMKIGKNSNRKYTLGTATQKCQIKQSSCEKDIGIHIDSKLSFLEHISKAVNKANSIMGIIRRTFQYLDEETFLLLYKALVRPHVEYGNTVWNPHFKKDIEIVEKMQRRATKQIPTLKEMSYEDRLRKLNLPTLKFRRMRGDLIEVYKMMKGIYDPDVGEMFTISRDRTRGHSMKLYKPRTTSSMRHSFFTHRIVDIWNTLPEIVVSAPNLRSFERLLDKYWSKKQEVYFDWEKTFDVRTGRPEPKSNEEEQNEEDLDIEAEEPASRRGSR